MREQKPEQLEPQKIILIGKEKESDKEGSIHPNELDLTPALARELKRRGHTIKIMPVPFKETLHGHSKHGKGIKPFKNFTGAAFVNKIGFQNPEWHVIGMHSTPPDELSQPGLQPEKQGTKLRFTLPPPSVGTFHYRSGLLHNELVPIVYKDGRFQVMLRLRHALEVPAKASKKKSIDIDWQKFTFGKKESLERAKSHYPILADARATYKVRKKKDLVKWAADEIEKAIKDTKKMETAIKERQGNGFLIEAVAKVPTIFRLRNNPEGVRRAIRIAERELKKKARI